MDERVIEHLIDIKQRLSRLETNADDIRQDLRDHRKESQSTGVRVTALEEDVNKAKGSIKSLSWIVGILGSILVILKALTAWK